MSTVTSLKPNRPSDANEWQLRVDLAAAFRLAVEFGWHEAVANHFSLAVSADGKKFLMTRNGDTSPASRRASCSFSTPTTRRP